MKKETSKRILPYYVPASPRLLKIEGVLCADGGPDIKLMPPSVLNDDKNKSGGMKVVKFNKARKYGLVVSNNTDRDLAQVICDCQVTLNIQIFFRHGSSLFI